ncbi:MAG TPA: B12-binding domain-containing radical SAM protein, partial [Acidimicrobiales bacterium]|nr:B12-binding domain-containing radical SAM protein [Acidimicrobiales bacterium]
PVRERPAAQVRQMVSDGLRRTGYDEVSLTSLSSADYSGIEDTVKGIINDPMCTGQVSVSLPSLRVDAFTVAIASEIQKVRRTGLTFAPEAGSWRMRQVINKLIRE